VLKFWTKTGHFPFLRPFLGSGSEGLGAMYTVHLRLIGKLVMDFLFVLIELFLSLGVTAEALQGFTFMHNLNLR